MTFDVYNVLNILRTDHSILVRIENPDHSPDEESLACGDDLHDGGLISCHHGDGDGGGPRPVCPHSCEICSHLESCHHHLAWIWTFLGLQTFHALDDAHCLCENPCWTWTWNLYLY